MDADLFAFSFFSLSKIANCKEIWSSPLVLLTLSHEKIIMMSRQYKAKYKQLAWMLTSLHSWRSNAIFFSMFWSSFLRVASSICSLSKSVFAWLKLHNKVKDYFYILLHLVKSIGLYKYYTSNLLWNIYPKKIFWEQTYSQILYFYLF